MFVLGLGVLLKGYGMGGTVTVRKVEEPSAVPIEPKAARERLIIGVRRGTESGQAASIRRLYDVRTYLPGPGLIFSNGLQAANPCRG